MLPNFLFIGAEKSGTTWFYRHLKRHPDICLSETKELHFFNKYGSTLTERNEGARFDLDWYKSFFRFCTDEKAVGEITPMYLCDPCAPERIRALLPDVKLVCCLRNPVDRCYSHYWMAKRQGTTNLSFREVIEREDTRFVKRGMYHEQIRTYLNLFSSEQMCILVSEEVFREPRVHLRKLSLFLEVDPDFYDRHDDISVRKKENEALSYRWPWLHEAFGKIAGYMRTNSYTEQMLNFLKVAGVTKKMISANKKPRSYPPMCPSNRAKLQRRYASSVKEMENILGRRIAVWE